MKGKADVTNLPRRPVTIFGAGFSGLATAFYLNRAGFHVDVYETREKPGGLIDTLKTPEGLVETAANALLNSHFVEELFTAIKVPLIFAKRTARRRFILRDGVCRRWPLRLSGSVRVLFFALRFLINRQSVRPHARESIESWGQRVLGQDAAHYLLNAGLQGIYAGDPSRLSASLILARFFLTKPTVASSPKIRGSVTPELGMSQLISGLVKYLKDHGVDFHFNSDATISEESNHPVIVATDPHSAAILIEKHLPQKAILLRQIEMLSVVTTTAHFNQTDAKTKGFGVLFAPNEKRRALGVLKNDFIFSGRGRFSETWIQGGALAEHDLNQLSDEAIRETIRQERSLTFGLNESPISSLITRWPRGIPHYTLELETMIPELNRVQKNIFLMGNYLGDLGLGKILQRASSLPARIGSEGLWR